jgi:hypothetical protein
MRIALPVHIGSQQHPFRHHTPNHRRLQIGHHHDLLPHQLVWTVGLSDARHQRAGFTAQIDGQFQQLLRLRHGFRRRNRRHAQLNPLELLNRDELHSIDLRIQIVPDKSAEALFHRWQGGR